MKEKTDFPQKDIIIEKPKYDPGRYVDIKKGWWIYPKLIKALHEKGYTFYIKAVEENTLRLWVRPISNSNYNS